MQKAMAKAQKGTVVERGDGLKMDARDVKNGSGGKKGHRAKNNRLKDADGCGFGAEGGSNDNLFKNAMNEALKRSADDEYLMNERKTEREEMERLETELLLKGKDTGCDFGGSKMKELINVDDDDDDDEKLNDNKKVATALANNMFERVNKKMKKIYSSEIKSFGNLEDVDEKEVKKVELKKMRKSLSRLKDDKNKGDHVDLIERLTSDGDDLISPNKMNSQNVMELILNEHEMEEENESNKGINKRIK